MPVHTVLPRPNNPLQVSRRIRLIIYDKDGNKPPQLTPVKEGACFTPPSRRCNGILAVLLA